MQIDLKDAFVFFQLLKPLYRELAMMQFFCAERIGEIAGPQWSNIDLDNRGMLIKHTCIWDGHNKTFIELKNFPKNKEARPLNYGTIQLNYREAQRKGKLPYSGTHIFRQGMAKLARKVGGGLDAVLAMTGHKDIKLADHYSKYNEDDQKDFS